MSGSVARPINGRLALVREKLGMDKGQFADFLGVHRNTYRSWEAQQSDVGVEALVATAAAGWNTNWLLTGEGPEKLAELGVGPSTEMNSLAEVDTASHALSPARLTIALELADKIVGDGWLPTSVYADLLRAAYGLLEEGVPYDEILSSGQAFASRSPEGKRVEAGNRTLAGNHGSGSASTGTTKDRPGRQAKKRRAG